MNHREYGEREITLCELTRYVLKKWRIILVITVLAMVFSSGYKYYRMDKSRTPEISEEIVLTPEQKEQVERAVALETKLEALRKKIEMSTLFQADAMDASIYTMQYFIGHEKGKEIKEIYQNALQTHYGENDVLDRNILLSADGAESSLVIRIISEREPLEAEVAEIKAYINEFEKTVNTMIGGHMLLLIDENQAYGYSKELMQWQRTIQDDFQKKEQQLLQETQNLTDGQRQYLEQKKNDILKKDAQPEHSRMELIKVVLFVGILVFCSCCMVYVLIYFTSSRILEEDELPQVYHLNSFGSVFPATKKAFGFLDRKIQNIGENKNVSDLEKKEFVINNIKLKCSEKNLGEICFVNLSPSSHWFDDLETELKKDGRNIIRVEYLGQNAIALKKIVDIKNIILLVKLEKTRKREIISLFRLCDEYEVHIAGAVCCL